MVRIQVIHEKLTNITSRASLGFENTKLENLLCFEDRYLIYAAGATVQMFDMGLNKRKLIHKSTGSGIGAILVSGC